MEQDTNRAHPFIGSNDEPEHDGDPEHPLESSDSEIDTESGHLGHTILEEHTDPTDVDFIEVLQLIHEHMGNHAEEELEDENDESYMDEDRESESEDQDEVDFRESDDSEIEESEDEGVPTSRPVLQPLQQWLAGHGPADEHEDRRRETERARRRRLCPDYPKIPSEDGRKLMSSGVFGYDAPWSEAKKPVARLLLDRELGIGGMGRARRIQHLIAQHMLPSSKADMIVHYDEPVYSGQFSRDGNFFYSTCRDLRVRIYDTTNPHKWRYYKTVTHPGGAWTITDASLSPDNKFLVSTSISSTVCLAPTSPNDTGDPYGMDLADGDIYGQGRFGIWSIRFSGDGRELVAGTNANSIIVYDIESRRVLHRIVGHKDDVNAVCFADSTAPHILFSGSDDSVIKFWDRRSIGDGREAGAFVGHIEGITYIDSKDDGRYILSNGKDQCMKLWDIRMALSTDRFQSLRLDRTPTFDYRLSRFRKRNWFRDPNENSLVTFRGHKVLQTLIRCHFSPPISSNSRYVYSGSQDGKVYIWNLDATLVKTIDVRGTTKTARHHDLYPLSSWMSGDIWQTCVRDASWHPHVPVLVASAWNGYGLSKGTCTLHSYNVSSEDEALPRLGWSANERMEVYPERDGAASLNRFFRNR